MRQKLSTTARAVVPMGLMLGFATLGVATLGAQRPAAPPAPDTLAITPDMVNAGRRVFHGQGTCFACHGSNLEGGPIAPTLKSHAWKDAKGGELDAIYYVVTHGVAGTAMVSHPGGISDADALRIAMYIWAVGHRGATP